MASTFGSNRRFPGAPATRSGGRGPIRGLGERRASDAAALARPARIWASIDAAVRALTSPPAHPGQEGAASERSSRPERPSSRRSRGCGDGRTVVPGRGRTARPPRCSCSVEAFAAFVLVVERDVGAEQGGHLVPRAGAVASDTAAVVGATELPHELGERAAEPDGPGLRADGLGVDAGEQEVLERGRLDAVIAGLLFMAGGCGGAR